MNAKTLLSILKRTGLALLTVWAVITIAFFAVEAVQFGAEAAAPSDGDTAAQTHTEDNLSLFPRYLAYLRDAAANRDFGVSLSEGRDVAEILSDGIRTTVKLCGFAALCTLCAGVLLGSAAALGRNSFLDKFTAALTAVFASLPAFLIGSLLLAAFAAKAVPADAPADGSAFHGLVLPAVTLALYPAACIARTVRAAMLDALGQDYIRTARARGLSGPRVFFGHVLQNALLPVIACSGPLLGRIVTAALVVERIFNVPGLGGAFADGVLYRDYPVLLGAVAALACLYALLHLICGILYIAADPRTRITDAHGGTQDPWKPLAKARDEIADPWNCFADTRDAIADPWNCFADTRNQTAVSCPK